MSKGGILPRSKTHRTDWEVNFRYRKINLYLVDMGALDRFLPATLT